MKQKIFNRGNGWYIPCFNYKDNTDVAYLNLFFPQNTEPTYYDNGTGKSVKTIDILEAKFTSFKKKIGLTIFKFEEITDLAVTEDNVRDAEPYQVPLNDGESDMFGRKSYIEEDDLPFY